jgi:excisionase family DNA binding protein
MDAEQSMLTTGQVARLLGCSRQHVVDLCNAGKLESTTIGTHRRIARRDVDRLLARGFVSVGRRSVRCGSTGPC